MNKLYAVLSAVLICTGLSAEEVLLDSIMVKGPQAWWTLGSQINQLRLPPPQEGATIKYYDIDGDGAPEVLRTVTASGIAVQWIDENGNMAIGDLSGDQVDDCLMIDRNSDGLFGHWDDLIIDWVDTDNDGQSDIQVVVENKREDTPAGKYPAHYMMVFDLDHDGVFNYIDWETMQLRCWLHYGLADFYTDYHGNSLFLKNHNTPQDQGDVRLNWENPFVFLDPDRDGLTEMTLRLCDRGGDVAHKRIPDGLIDWAAICVDLDNDNNPENPLDLDMTVHFRSEKGTSYMQHEHVYKKLRGLPEADCYFMDPGWRQNTVLIYPDEKETMDFIFKEATWDYCWLVFDEDDDCKRWERVELQRPGDLWRVGEKNGGLDQHRQSDAVGDRGEFDSDNSGKGALYISPMDGKIHLYGAEWGAWRIDQNARHYQMMGGNYDIYGPGRQQSEGTEFPVVKYEDCDGNGFFDRISYDWNCDGEFEEVVDYLALGLDDSAKVLDISKMKYRDYRRLYRKVARGMWKKGRESLRQAERLGIDTSWYSIYKSPKSLRQKYEFGFWLQTYINHDIADLQQR